MLLFVSENLTAAPVETCVFHSQKPNLSVSVFNEQDSNAQAIAGGVAGLIGSSVAHSKRDTRNKEYESQIEPILEESQADFIEGLIRKMDVSLNINHPLFRVRALNTANTNKFYTKKGKLKFATPSDSACKLLILIGEKISIKSNYKNNQEVSTVLSLNMAFYNTKRKRLEFRKRHDSDFKIESSFIEFLNNKQLINSIRNTALETVNARFYNNIKEQNGFYKIFRSLGISSPYQDEIALRENISKSFTFSPLEIKDWAVKKISNAMYTTYPKKHRKGISIQSQVVAEYLISDVLEHTQDNTVLTNIEQYVVDDLYADWQLEPYENEALNIPGFSILFFKDNASNKKSLVYFKNHENYGVLHAVRLGSNHELFLRNYEEEMINYIKKSILTLNKEEK